MGPQTSLRSRWHVSLCPRCLSGVRMSLTADPTKQICRRVLPLGSVCSTFFLSLCNFPTICHKRSSSRERARTARGGGVPLHLKGLYRIGKTWLLSIATAPLVVTG
uniref:Uncharacterized protein n=1 Tax=Engystomops pustulosus TaxID=76066 RepID=A0AAV6YTS8_ENGPU|nr:hypothetical protein GDO81_024592 [Engystomops pustulosus]